MSRLKQIKDDYANEQGRDDWEEYFKWLDLCHTPHDVMQKHYDEIARRYADECAREALRLASENVRMEEHDLEYKKMELVEFGMYSFSGDESPVEVYISKQSILSEDNLPSHS